ncbi:MAG TPA: hypothetical protein DCP92_07550, partial [Nitrospiraceae bacterium]|nr:hypothetical protein [Nitrospiraceae bacterium]
MQVAPVEFPISFSVAQPGTREEPGALKPEANLQTMADQLLLRQFSPAPVLSGRNGDISYIS